MGLNFAHGAVQWLTSQVLNTTIPVTGLGFSPKAIRFYWVGLQSNSPTDANSQTVSERRGVGFAQSTTSRACVGTTSTDASAAADCGSIWSNTACVITVSAAGAVDGLLDINSIDADGFTLIVDDVAPANITVFWEAWGGGDITNVTIGAIAEPAATGVQNYTATGFEASPIYNDQCVMFAGVQTVNASGVGQQQDSGLHVGFSTSLNNILPVEQVTVCGNSDDGSATMDTDGYIYQGSCISMITIAGGNINASASLSSYGTNQFSLNWNTRTTTNRRSIYMAIKGGQWKVSTLTIFGNLLNNVSTQVTSSFNQRGVSLISAMRQESSINVTTANDLIAFGSASSKTSRNSASVLDENGTANTEIDLSISYSRAMLQPSVAGGLQASFDINTLGGRSFTLITTLAGGTIDTSISCLLFGDRKLSTASIGHPFIC